MDGLRVVHVVCLEADAASVLLGEERGAGCGGGGEVLYYELETGVQGCDGKGDVAVRTADL